MNLSGVFYGFFRMVIPVLIYLMCFVVVFKICSKLCKRRRNERPVLLRVSSDFDDFDAAFRFHERVFWIIIGTVLWSIFLGFIICIICVVRYRRNSNPGTIYTSPPVIITSQQHYPAAGPNVVVNPIVYAPANTGYQQMQMQQQPQQQSPATAPQMMEFGQTTQGPPSYQQATYFHQEAYNPEYRKQ